MTAQDTAVDTATIVVTDVELQQETTTDVKETTSAPPVAEIKAEIKADTKEKPHSEKKIGGFIKLPFGITISHIILIICWLAAIGISIWFIVSVSLHYEHAFHAPVTSLSLVSHVPMDFPSVTVCNWNAERECSTCNITLDHVYGILEDGSVGEVKIPYKVAEIDDHDLLFRCYVFNYDGSMHPATTTGYGGMYALYFNITKMPASALNRNGLQVSFHEVGTVASVFEETNFAVERVDNFFTLTKYTTNRLHAPTQSSSSSSSSSSSHRALQSESTSSHDSNVEVRWTSTLSTVDLSEVSNDQIVISFAYATLNEHVITEVVTLSIEGVLGEIGGVIGVLMGIDVLKLVRGLMEIPYSIKHKTVSNLWGVFN